mmetsp:Transcript_29563/g.68513  ORF Transcript_29563/g.68513 Transcript_29563/m.68513 type:complete len:455 (-) Transcript_29563:28-1392(-)
MMDTVAEQMIAKWGTLSKSFMKLDTHRAGSISREDLVHHFSNMLPPNFLTKETHLSMLIETPAVDLEGFLKLFHGTKVQMKEKEDEMAAEESDEPPPNEHRRRKLYSRPQLSRRTRGSPRQSPTKAASDALKDPRDLIKSPYDRTMPQKPYPNPPWSLPLSPLNRSCRSTARTLVPSTTRSLMPSARFLADEVSVHSSNDEEPPASQSKEPLRLAINEHVFNEDSIHNLLDIPKTPVRVVKEKPKSVNEMLDSILGPTGSGSTQDPGLPPSSSEDFFRSHWSAFRPRKDSVDSLTELANMSLERRLPLTVPDSTTGGIGQPFEALGRGGELAPRGCHKVTVPPARNTHVELQDCHSYLAQKKETLTDNKRSKATVSRVLRSVEIETRRQFVSKRLDHLYKKYTRPPGDPSEAMVREVTRTFDQKPPPLSLSLHKPFPLSEVQRMRHSHEPVWFP